MITYSVKLAGRGKRPETVHADYFRVDEHGTVTFRRVNPDQSYPIFVKCFARGSWLSVENTFAGHER